MSELTDVDRLRTKFPRAYKALVQLYPMAWDTMLAAVEAAMEQGKTASVVAGKLSILRGLDRSTRRWVVLCLSADRREVMLRQQTSFLTQLHDKSLDDLLAELQALEGVSLSGGEPLLPRDDVPRGYLFISHHANSAGRLAIRLAESIEAAGCACWIAPRNVRSGLDWNEEVYGASQRCGAMVLLYSDDAQRSNHVKGEVAIAVARAVPVFVVKVTEGDPARLNIGLAAYQHSVDWIGRSHSDIAELTRDLQVHLRAAGVADAA